MRRYLFVIVCVAIVLLILLLAAIIVLYAVVPAIIRSTIDKVRIDFRSVNIEQIQTNSFTLRAELVLSNTGSMSATILAPLVIQVDDVGTVTQNEPISISGSNSANSTIVPMNAPFVITNMDAFNIFSRNLIFQPNVVWHLKANATIRPLSSHMISYSNIPFNKEVTLGAFDGLRDVTIGAIDLSRSNATYIIVDLIIKMQNPSIFGIDVGRLFFTLQYDNNSIGYVESNSGNITLHSGENAIKFFGELQSASNESYDAISVIIQNFLTNQTSNVTALAGPNCTSYPLFGTSMTGLALDAQMPPFTQQLIESLSFESMSLTPSTKDKTAILSASIIVTINSPLGLNSPLDIQSMDMHVDLIYQDSVVGHLNVRQASVNKTGAVTYRAEFDNQILMIDSTGAIYQKFVQDFIDANETNLINFRISGLAAVTGSFALGPLNVDGILVESNVSLVGLNGLSNVHVDGISVDGEEGVALRLLINTTIENTGKTNVQLDNFTLYMADVETNTILGHVPIDIFALHPGSNEILLNGLLAPLHESDLPIVGKFFSAYLNDQTQAVKLFHNKTSIDNATALDLTISGLSMQANLDGIQTQLIRQVKVLNFGIEFDRNDVNKVYVSGRLSVLFELPSNVNMTFKALTTSINFVMRPIDGEDMGRIILTNLPVQHNQTTNELFMSFEKQEFIVLNTISFKEFAANLVLTTNVTVGIEGVASAVAAIRIGNITLTDISINDTIELVGYNQFDNGALRIDNTDITEVITSSEVALQVKTEIANPSVVNILYGGRLQLNLCNMLNGTSLGTVTIDPFFLEPQGNATIVNASGIFNMTNTNTIAAREFISHMVSGIDNEVELRGTLEDNSTGTNIPYLSLAVAGLRIHTRVPGLTGDKALLPELIVKKLTAAEIAGIALGFVKQLPARIRVLNPFSTSITINALDVKVDYGAKIDDELQLGLAKAQPDLNVGAHQEVTSDYIDVTIAARLSTLTAMIGPLLTGHAHLSLYGTIDVTIGDDFVLQQLPVTLLNITTKEEGKPVE